MKETKYRKFAPWHLTIFYLSIKFNHNEKEEAEKVKAINNYQKVLKTHLKLLSVWSIKQISHELSKCKTENTNKLVTDAWKYKMRETIAVEDIDRTYNLITETDQT